MRVLVLEDDDQRILWFAQKLFCHRLTFAFTSVDAIDLLNDNSFDLIFLDHDLCEEHYNSYIASLSSDEEWRADKYDHNTGMAVAKFLAENPDKSPSARIIVHTLNPIAQLRMQNTLFEGSRTCEVVPFSILARRGHFE